MTDTPPWRRLLRGLGPAVAPPHGIEPARAALGAALGLGVLALFLFSPVVDKGTGLFLIAPLGASAVLVFAVPNSPLAQPWSAVMGNTLSGLVAWAVLSVVPDPALGVALSVGLAILAMALARATHPPGGAVALLSALNAPLVREMGPRFALVAAGGGTLALVITAILWNRATGRVYPFRQPAETGPHGTHDPAPERRLGLTADELRQILADYRQDANLGPEDLGRLIEAAESAAAGHRLGALTCAQVMSRDLVTVGPAAPLAEVAALFSRHGFTSVPVVEDGRLAGVLFQIDMIRRALAPGLADASAGSVAERGIPTVTPETPAAALIPMLKDGEAEAVPVLDRDRLVGIVTRSDLVSALAHDFVPWAG